jgi:hypothetical protein
MEPPMMTARRFVRWDLDDMGMDYRAIVISTATQALSTDLRPRDPF